MGLWALTTEAVQGLVREHWGKKIPVGDTGDKMDTGVQEFVDELVARLASQSPIQMPGPLQLIQPANAPAIQITSGNGDTIFGDGGTVVIEIINNVTNETININNDGTITVVNEGGTVINNNTSGESFPGGSSGSVQVLSGVEGSVSVDGCTVTLTLTPTYTTLSFDNGLYTGSS